jgi:biotin transport system substrate-specific component
MSWGDVRTRTSLLHVRVNESAWTRVAASAAFGGFLMLMGVLSFPLPWTPVPFSMMPLGLLVAGAYQRPGYAALSVGIYLLAAGLGAPVFADGDSGVRHFIGATAGYLMGYAVLASFIGWYMQERRALLSMRWVRIVGGVVALQVIAGLVAIGVYFSGRPLRDYGFSEFGIGRSVLWSLVFMVAATTALTVWSLQRRRGQGLQALNLFLVMIAGIGILHILGVAGLIFIAGLAPLTAIIVGSVVFMPFDIIKAGLAVGATLPFIPAPSSLMLDEESSNV